MAIASFTQIAGAQSCGDPGVICMDPITVIGSPIDPIDFDPYWISDPYSGYPPGCDEYGCEDDSNGDNPSTEPPPEEVPDIQCFSSTMTIGPLTTSQVFTYRRVEGFFENLVSGGIGLIAGSIATGLGASGGASNIYTLVSSAIAEVLFSGPSNYWCGKITNIESKMCVGTDVNQLGTPQPSDFWGDYVLEVNTSFSTGQCVDDMGVDIGGGN